MKIPTLSRLVLWLEIYDIFIPFLAIFTAFVSNIFWLCCSAKFAPRCQVFEFDEKLALRINKKNSKIHSFDALNPQEVNFCDSSSSYFEALPPFISCYIHSSFGGSERGKKVGSALMLRIRLAADEETEGKLK